jgi:hypothetical protein
MMEKQCFWVGHKGVLVDSRETLPKRARGDNIEMEYMWKGWRLRQDFKVTPDSNVENVQKLGTKRKEGICDALMRRTRAR